MYLHILEAAVQVPSDAQMRLLMLLAVPCTLVLFVYSVTGNPIVFLVVFLLASRRMRERHLRLVRKRKQIPLASIESAYPVLHAIVHLAKHFDYRQAPTVFLDPRSRFPAATIGTPMRPALALGPKMLQLHESDKNVFYTILVHEFFHMRLGDLWISYIARAAMRTLIVVAALTAIILPLGSNMYSVLIFAPLQIGIMVWVCTVGVLGVERQREFYADAFTALHFKGTAIVRRALTVSERPVRRAFRSFRTHPTFSERRAALEEPERALRMRASWVFAAGIATGVLVPSLFRFLFSLFENTAVGAYSLHIAAGIAGTGLALVLSTGIWRNTHLAMMLGAKPDRGVAAGAAAGVGLIIGSLLPVEEAYGLSYPAMPLFVFAIVAIPVALVLYCAWLSWCARIYLIREPCVWLRVTYMEDYTGALLVLRVGSAVVGAALVYAIYLMTIGSSVEISIKIASVVPPPSVADHFLIMQQHVPMAFFTYVGHHPGLYVVLALAALTTWSIFRRGQRAAYRFRSDLLASKPPSHPKDDTGGMSDG